MAGGDNKCKELASSVSPEVNRSKKYQGGDICGVCNAIVMDEDECSIQCQWCSPWEHSEYAKISIKECAILAKSSIRIVFLCTSCAPNLDEALEYFGDKDNHPPQKSMDSLPEKQGQLENKLSVVESKLHEIKEELTLQLSKCREMLGTPETNSAKPPAGLALLQTRFLLR